MTSKEQANARSVSDAQAEEAVIAQSQAASQVDQTTGRVIERTDAQGVVIGAPRMTQEMIDARDKQIVLLEEQLRILKEGPQIVELTDEEKKTGLHASNAPFPSPTIMKDSNPGHDTYYPPKVAKETFDRQAALSDPPSSTIKPELGKL